MMGYYGYNGYGPFGNDFGFFGPILMIIFWVVIIVLIMYLIRSGFGIATHKHNGGGGGETALDILEKRYARGEIEKKDFEEKKKDLTKS